jgi:hypothetical protein
MPGTAEQQKLTEVLLVGLERASFPSQAELDRVERLISSREELEDYVAILLQKVQGKLSPDRQLLDRLERLLRVLKRAEREERQ